MEEGFKPTLLKCILKHPLNNFDYDSLIEAIREDILENGFSPDECGVLKLVDLEPLGFAFILALGGWKRSKGYQEARPSVVPSWTFFSKCNVQPTGP